MPGDRQGCVNCLEKKQTAGGFVTIGGPPLAEGKEIGSILYDFLWSDKVAFSVFGADDVLVAKEFQGGAYSKAVGAKKL